MITSPPVRELIRRCQPLSGTASLRDAAKRMVESGQFFYAIEDESRQIRGFVDYTDIIRLVAGSPANSDPDLTGPLNARTIHISENAPITLAASLLAEHRVCHLAVTGEDGVLKGVVTAADVLAALNRLYSERLSIGRGDPLSTVSADTDDEQKPPPGEYEQLLRTLIDEIPSIILLKDWNGCFLLANRALAALYKTTPEEMIGKDDGAFNPNRKQVAFYLQNIRDVMRSGKTQIVLEESTNVETGETRYFQSIKKPLQDSNGQPCIMVIANDITDIRASQKKVEESERSLKYAMEAIGEGLWDWDISTGQVSHNAQWCKALGFDESKMQHPLEDFSRLIWPEDLEKVRNALDQALKGDGYYSSQHRMMRKDGQVIWVLDRGRVVERDNEDHPTRMVGSFSDITERKEAEEVRLTASVFTHSHDGIMICDANQVILDANPAFTEITGYSRDDVIGKKTGMMTSGIREDSVYESMERILKEEGFWKGEVWNRDKSKNLYIAETTISAVESPSGQLINYIHVFSDVSLLKEQQKRLEMLAHYDALTQLPNRVLLADRILKAQSHADRHGSLLAICYLDLDNFKPINDQYGHSAGDELLVEVAGRLQKAIRAEDTAARLGGDEFVLLLNDVDSVEQCNQAVGRILETLSDPVLIGGEEIEVAASIGIVIYPAVDADADTLLRHADQAMYQAKLSGRNCSHLYDSSQDQHLQARHEIVEDIQKAFRAGEFELFYQPQVDLREGKSVGLEALIRWRHPERGLIFPGEFLPVLGGHRLVAEIDLWVFESAMRQISHWRKQDIHQPISINLNGETLLRQSFVSDLQEILSGYPAIPPHSIEFEVLETAALEDMHHTSQIFRLCKAMGFSIALDDFGTGYSSLTYLRRLPTDTLKIDQSFIQNMLSDPEDMAIVKSVIGLTRAFNRKVVAEGVENGETAAALLEIGCDVAQGYGIARPMPAGEIPGWLREFPPPEPGNT